jgi:hypothetical protein
LTRGYAADSIEMVVATEEYMKKLVSALLASSMLFLYVPTLGAAGPPVKISQQKLTCIPGDAQTLVLCEVTPSTSIAWARLYFNSNTGKGDYWVEMRREAGNHFSGVLPFVDRTFTKGVTSRIDVKSGDGTVFSTEPANVAVSSNCPVVLSANQKKNARNLVVGATTPEQPLAPPADFLCTNIVSVITSKGEMQPADGCRKLLAALPAGAAGAGAAVGASTGLAVGVGVGVVAAVAAAGLIYSNNSGNKTPVSSARPAAQSPTHN